MSFPTIEPKEVEDLLKNNHSLNFIDVRENDEVVHGMIPGAKHIPLGEIPNRLNELNHSKEYIMVCRSGKRSEKACGFLSDNNFKVKNMTGGMMNWEGQTK
ncbi:rhodanese-like domain-containing protein [Fictibacillus barbaricus]|uniref:Rhodanese-related sulfurtransferase n=1 Tax=Fictibacillus barbaricus TaxID=182136 RepID=A0ABU1U5H1_9BACL|nr:rhodanese-like domain-containing protein [Fictibacillus barbaricus]MDR7074697.1 rhodanese-related sulfurtransferase [Fictibacillus barbaricus]